MLEVRVVARTDEALDVCSFELAGTGREALPAFSAGSHVDVELPGGLVRQYSLCNDPAERHRYLVAVLREPASRGGSVAMHDRVRVGDTLRISAPKNHFALARDARRSVLLAGGIGVTPILCMAERLAVLGADFDLHYCARSRARAAFVERIEASAFAARVQLHFDDGDAAQRLDLASLLTGAQPDVHLYVCGPKGFMDAVLRAARAGGWPEAQLHYEFFAGAVADPAGGADFQVKLASSGQLVPVAAGQTVVDALAAVGVNVPVSCGQGVCGTCLTRVLEGAPDHQDLYLSPDEQALNDQFTPCCSRSKTPVLVLDL
jgi:vanillate O-demethylase ferredoxin subunit